MSDQERIALLRGYKASVNVKELLARYGAHSIGIGRKIVDGEVTDTPSLLVYVTNKLVSSDITPFETVPKRIDVLLPDAKRRRRITTDVIETPMARFEVIDPTTNVRPVPGGVSCGISGHTGTIGGWVWDTTDDTIVMLSNHHVFFHTAGADIIQRGSYDGGSSPAEKIGDVKRGIVRSTTANNIVDCAIGDPDSSDIYDLRVLEIGPAVYAIDVAADGMMVEKYGRTTEHTFGEVTDTDWEGYVDGVYYFVDCLRVDARAPSADWSAGGDSGSCVFSQTPIEEGSTIKPVVGLHFAGSSTHGIECKIQNVFNQLNLTTLCDGSFSAVSDSLFESETEAVEAEARFGALSELAAGEATRFSPHTFVSKERLLARFRNPYSGISRDMQKRLMASKRGRVITDFVDANRAELLSLFAKDGDVRRTTLGAIRPLVAKAQTTTDVLERKVTGEDLERLEKLGRELSRKGGERMQKALSELKELKPKEGVTIADALRIRL